LYLQDQIFDALISFEEKALKVFEFQIEYNSVYSRFYEALGVKGPASIQEIPLLPIQAFKEKEIITTKKKLSANSYQLFLSSGTSGMTRSRHIVTDLEIYKSSILQGMKQFYDLEDFVIWAYTPGYNSNLNSSLIWMLNVLIQNDESGLSDFLEIGKPLLQSHIERIEQSGKKLMIFGAAFGLLDLLEISDIEIPESSIVMETGGMKTHRREMSKSELHHQLGTGFRLPKRNIHSEYGMTELLSQAYSLGDEWFECVPWMKVSIRNPDNPMKEVSAGEEGLIGVIDLANINSCSFILTGDKGVMNSENQFQILGRWNPKNLRGCNFLIDQD
jgi:phenylacetate-coenzyme A ligase PaaK-like adenylate-forming protein